MAKIVIIGAGIGGIPMAFEMKENARKPAASSISDHTAVPLGGSPNGTGRWPVLPGANRS